MMTIAINCWILKNKKPDGIGYFTIHAIPRLIRSNPEVHFMILCDKNYEGDYFNFPNVSHHKIFPSRRHPVLYVYYMEKVLGAFLKKHTPGLLLSVDGFLSLRSDCRQVPIIHDINFEHYPKDIDFKNRVYYRYFFKRFAKKAIRIATISEYSKKDITGTYKVNPEQIDNVSAGINDHFFPIDPDSRLQVRQKWTGGKPFFIFVGSMHPRKNIPGLIEAFSLFKQHTGSEFKLVLVGSFLWSSEDINRARKQSSYQADIIFPGRLPDEEVQQLVAAAFALSFVPVFEGFGLPIVEAMQSGVPVICSNVTSMPEVAGDAALLVDPFNVESISAAMEKLYEDPGLREELIRKGFEQKTRFSWDRTAGLLWDCIRKALNTK